MAHSLLEVLRDSYNNSRWKGASPDPIATLDSDLMKHFKDEDYDKELRSVGWQALIRLRFGDDVTYVPKAKPGWKSYIDEQLRTIESFSTNTRSTYEIFGSPYGPYSSP